jgi:hypothetical protein
MIAIAFALLIAQATPAPAASPAAGAPANSENLAHEPITKAVRGTQPTIKVIAKRPSASFAPLVFARATGTQRYFGYPMGNRGHDSWVARLPLNLLIGASFEYFIEVREAGGVRSYVGSDDKPFVVAVEDAPILPAMAQVTSAEGAMVSLDGKDIGVAPQTVQAPEGRHLVAVVLPDGRGAEQSVDFVMGKTKKVNLMPSGGGPGKLDIASDPRGARVYLDGAQVGITPYSGEVLAGKHVLALELDGYIREEREVEFHFGRDVEQRFQLKQLPKEPALSIESTPERAAVFIDGVQKGTTPFLAPVKAGLHDVVLKLAGRGDAASSFEMPSDRDLSLRITLPEVPKNAAPRLIIYSKPDGAALKIDEVDSGVTPWSGEIAEGKHKISISAEGYLPESREVEAIKNREGDVSFLLQRRPGPAKLTVETEPADGVEISIDGAVVGTTPLAQAVTLEPGEHQLQAAKATFRTLAQTVTAEQGSSIAVKLSLSPAPKDPLPPTIALNTEPVGARAYVDGKLVGETPVRIKSVSGPHDLKLMLDGYISRTSKIVLPADSGFELRVAVSLKRSRELETSNRPDPLLLARAQVTRALACYRLGDFVCALAAYRAAYEMKPIPDLLFNIAQTERKLGHLQLAITAYKAYLKEKKTGAVADVARQRLAECEAALANGTKLADDTSGDQGATPTLAHDPIAHTPRGKDLTVNAVAKSGKGGLGTVQACYRATIGDYKCQAMTKLDTATVPDQFSTTVPGAEVNDGFAYYVEAYDADGATHSQVGDKTNPISVKMDEELAAMASNNGPAPINSVIAPAGPIRPRLPAFIPYGTAGAAVLSTGLGFIFYAEGKSAASQVTEGGHTGAEVQQLETKVSNDQWRSNLFIGLGIALAAGAAALFVYDYY